MYFLAERRENVRPAYSGRGYCRIRPARNMIYSEKKGGVKNGLNQKSHVSLEEQRVECIARDISHVRGDFKGNKKMRRKKESECLLPELN